MAEATPEITLQVYVKALENLQNAYEILHTPYPDFMVESTKMMVSPEYPVEIRLKIGILLKGVLIEQWESIQPSRKVIRELLLNGLVMNVSNMPIIELISSIIVQIICLDPSHIWPNPLIELLNWMDDFNAIESSLELFLQLFGRLSETNGEQQSLCKEIVPSVLEKGFSIFAQPELNEKLREKILLLVYLVFRSISFADGTDNSLVNKCLDSTFQIWMSLFLSALQTSPKSHIFIKKLVLKILIVVFRDFGVYSRKSLSLSLIPVWKFFNSITQLYVGHIVYQIDIEHIDSLFSEESKELPQTNYRIINLQNDIEYKYLNEDDDYDNHIEGLCAYSIELITILVTKPALYNLIKFGTFPLLNTLTTFLIATKDQERQWVKDPSYFILNDEEELLQKSVRTLALRLINDIIEKYGDTFVQQILMVGEKLILNRDEKEFIELAQQIISKLNFQELKGQQSKEFDQDSVMQFMKTSAIYVSNSFYQKSFIQKRKETGYLLLGSFSEDIIVFQQKHESTFDIKKCMQNILIELERQNSSSLQARAIWSTTKYSELISHQFKELLVPFFESVLNYLKSEYPITLKIVSVKALGNYATKINKYNIQFQYKAEIMDLILQVLQEASQDQIIYVLESTINLVRFSSILATTLAKNGSKVLLSFFSIFHTESVVIKQFNELIMRICQCKDAYPHIFDVFCPFIMDCFQVFYEDMNKIQDKSKMKPTDIGLMSAIMHLTSIFIKYCSDNKAQEAFINLLPSMVNLILINEDPQLQVHTSQCLKNFIIIETGQILKMNLVQDVMKVNLKLLEVPQNSANESASLFAGNLVMITINNLLDGNPDINLLKSVVFKIYRSRMPSTVQSLVLVYARMIIEKPKESINFLTSWSIDNRMALKVLIDKWLLQQPLFRGKGTKNATFTALMKLFLLKDKTLENLLVIGYNPSHQNINSDVYAPFKILSLLIRCLDNEVTPHTQNNNDIKQEDERLEVEDDDDEVIKKDQFQDQVDVEIEKIKDDEEQDIAERFASLDPKEKKDKGLADLETGSTLYMSEFLDFNQEVGEECDETTEEDLTYLKDPCLNINLVDALKEFFQNLVKNDPDYLKFCLKNLLKEDINLLQKYIKLNF
ncbi:unnamed protein product [Paramecium pentaurelia]|uniref:Importin N-terminal domain-containing protein n=1 Tax=Paramecium pentaurelia TaxID=43138 RepID=A0A8S1S5I3_9CILI|nr:unnamed protein product [Paramecium pentaurelia]